MKCKKPASALLAALALALAACGGQAAVGSDGDTAPGGGQDGELYAGDTVKATAARRKSPAAAAFFGKPYNKDVSGPRVSIAALYRFSSILTRLAITSTSSLPISSLSNPKATYYN